jgi:hypothetical protein
VNYLSGPGKGVILIKLGRKGDRVLGFVASTGDRDLLRVETSRGAEQTISTAKYEVTGRGGRGRELLQRGQFIRVLREEVATPPPLDPWPPNSAILGASHNWPRAALPITAAPACRLGTRRRAGTAGRATARFDINSLPLRPRLREQAPDVFSQERPAGIRQPDA